MPKSFLPFQTAAQGEDLSQQTIEALRLYHGIIHSARVAIAVIEGKEMIVTVVNRACLELWGADSSIIGKSLYETLPHLMDQAGDILQNILTSAEPFFGNEVRYVVKKNGIDVPGYYDFVWQPRFGEDGSAVGIIAIATEVTERANTSRRVKESQERLHLLANSMPQLVWIAGADGTVSYYNEKVTAYSGAKKMADGSWQWEGFVHPDELDQTVRAWTNAVKEKVVYEAEHRLLMQDGTYRWHLSRAIPSIDDDGNMLSWFGTATDIHQQKTFSEKLEAEVKLRTAELEKVIEDLKDRKQKDEQKDTFISIASHELNTPLTIANGYIDLATHLATEQKDVALQTLLEKSRNALRRLNNIVRDFLDVNKMQHGQLQLNLQPLDFREVVHEAVDFARSIFPGRELSAIVPAQPIPITADIERLRHVLNNLLNNAFKYSSAGSPVALVVSLTDAEVQVAVKDEGVGISQEDLPRIFERYFRVKEIEHSHQGMGIGLYLAATIIQRHHGKIWVESEKGLGTKAFFTLPLQQPPLNTN